MKTSTSAGEMEQNDLDKCGVLAKSTTRRHNQEKAGSWQQKSILT